MNKVPPSSQQPNPGNQQSISIGDDPSNQQHQNPFGSALHQQMGQQRQFEGKENRFPDMTQVEAGSRAVDKNGAGSELNECNKDDQFASLEPLAEMMEDIGRVMSRMYQSPESSPRPQRMDDRRQPLRSIDLGQAWKQNSNSGEAVAGGQPPPPQLNLGSHGPANGSGADSMILLGPQSFDEMGGREIMEPQLQQQIEEEQGPMNGAGWGNQSLMQLKNILMKQESRTLAASSAQQKHSCGICQEGLVPPSQLKAHRNSLGQERYECEHCNKCFTGKLGLQRHLLTGIHTVARTFKCEICSASFKTETILTQHIKRSRHDPEFMARCKCAFCGKQFPNKTEFLNHAGDYAQECPHFR